jgi:hypothetical protein
VRRVLAAPAAELLQFQTIRCRFAILGRRIIPLFAITTLQRNDLSGHCSLPVYELFLVWGRGLCPVHAERSSAAYFRYAIISAIVPAPTVWPPSRIANRKPFSIATGVISSITRLTLSPGITISVPAGNSAIPVTSVVRK